MLDGFHLTNLQLGTLGSIYGLVALFCYPVSGYLADRFSARILLTISFSHGRAHFLAVHFSRL